MFELIIWKRKKRAGRVLCSLHWVNYSHYDSWELLDNSTEKEIGNCPFRWPSGPGQWSWNSLVLVRRPGNKWSGESETFWAGFIFFFHWPCVLKFLIGQPIVTDNILVGSHFFFAEFVVVQTWKKIILWGRKKTSQFKRLNTQGKK